MRSAPRPAQIDCSLGHACQFCIDETTCQLDKPHHNRVLIERRLAAIGNILIVLANKGGVGKSTVAANLAAGLALRGFQVGLADADIHGPNQSRFFGLTRARTRTTHAGLVPPVFAAPGIAHPIRLGSLAFLLQDDSVPVVWRDAYKHDFIHHLIGSFDWGPLDFLVIDMPPGTGNELITLTDMLEGCETSAVLVTTPQAVAQMDSLKAARFCRERGLPILGAVENMAGVTCPHCAGEFHVFPDAGLAEALAALEISRLAQIPLAPELASASDSGAPVVAARPDSPAARAFAPLVAAAAGLGQRSFDTAAARGLEDLLAQSMTDGDLQAFLAELPDGDRAELSAQIAGLAAAEAARVAGITTGSSR